MRYRIQAIALALLLLGGGAGVGHAEVAERPAPSGGVLSLLPPPQITDHSIIIAGTHTRLSGKGRHAVVAVRQGRRHRRNLLCRLYAASRHRGEKIPSARSPLYSTAVRERLPPICISARSARASSRRRPMEVFCRRRRSSWTIRDTWLDMTDLVFVDPVGTGYSREAPGQEARSFWGVNQDASVNGRLHPALPGAGRPHRRRRSFLPVKAMAGFGQHCLPGRCRKISASARAASCLSRRRSNSRLCAPTSSSRFIGHSNFRRWLRCACAAKASPAPRCGNGWPRSNAMRLATISSRLTSGLERGWASGEPARGRIHGPADRTRRTKLRTHSHGALRQGIRPRKGQCPQLL